MSSTYFDIMRAIHEWRTAGMDWSQIEIQARGRFECRETGTALRAGYRRWCNATGHEMPTLPKVPRRFNPEKIRKAECRSAVVRREREFAEQLGWEVAKGAKR